METNPHDPACYRITKSRRNHVRNEHEEGDLTRMAVEQADSLLELSMCPNCTNSVPALIALTVGDPVLAGAVIMEMLGALRAANMAVVRGLEIRDSLDEDTEAKVRAAAGVAPTPDYVPE